MYAVAGIGCPVGRYFPRGQHLTLPDSVCRTEAGKHSWSHAADIQSPGPSKCRFSLLEPAGLLTRQARYAAGAGPIAPLRYTPGLDAVMLGNGSLASSLAVGKLMHVQAEVLHVQDQGPVSPHPSRTVSSPKPHRTGGRSGRKRPNGRRLALSDKIQHRTARRQERHGEKWHAVCLVLRGPTATLMTTPSVARSALDRPLNGSRS
jgi:hypothetical protein